MAPGPAASGPAPPGPHAPGVGAPSGAAGAVPSAGAVGVAPGSGCVPGVGASVGVPLGRGMVPGPEPPSALGAEVVDAAASDGDPPLCAASAAEPPARPTATTTAPAMSAGRVHRERTGSGWASWRGSGRVGLSSSVMMILPGRRVLRRRCPAFEPGLKRT
ncbi:MAG: hypothetical protein DI639_17585 [Leifsonia xyli]|nr:MAG: hypothetical protein DI639_17585 [Leifsonia xyli]